MLGEEPNSREEICSASRYRAAVDDGSREPRKDKGVHNETSSIGRD